jgi:protein subunit release factor A
MNPIIVQPFSIYQGMPVKPVAVESGVTVYNHDTGIGVTVNTQRSQHKNRELALLLLRDLENRIKE